MKKRFISMIIVLSLLVALFSGVGMTASAVGYGQDGVVYEPLFDTGSLTTAQTYFDNANSFDQTMWTAVNIVMVGFGYPSLYEIGSPVQPFSIWTQMVDSIFGKIGYGQQFLGTLQGNMALMDEQLDLMLIRNSFNTVGVLPLYAFFPSANERYFGVTLRESTATVGGSTKAIMRPYLNINRNTGFFIVDSHGGYPYFIVDSGSSTTPSQTVRLAYYNRNIVDSMTNAAYEISLDDLALYQNVYGSQYSASYFNEGDYTYSGYKANGSQFVLCVYDGSRHYAVYTKYKNQTTPSAPEGVVDLGFNPIVNGNYALEFVNPGSKFKFSYANQYEFQSAANNPYTSVVNLNVTGTDGTVYPLQALVYGSLQGDYYINLAKGTTNIPTDSVWYHKLSSNASKLFAAGNAQLGIPYQYGGVNPSMGFDCSGLVKYVYRTAGVYDFPDYNANQLYNVCTPTSQAEAMPGDLVFFTNTGDPAYAEKTHVGIYAGAGMMLVAPRTGDVVKYQSVSELAARNPQYGRVPTNELVSRNLLVMKRGGDYATDDPYNYYTDNDGNNFNLGISTNTNFINEQNNTIVNISGGDGFSQAGGNAITLYLDDLIYDEATKSYSSYSHSAYQLNNGNNYINVNYNYEYNFYIDYTSVTYIGTTADANETYNFYYELPDGRNSSDMSPDDLLPLDIQIDVLPYKRSTDDTRLRSLYHFNGNTLDSSYWNYVTEFTWNTGASITYMDAGTNFQGALYLDELEHDFTIELPSAIGTGDFTVEFRYYQSYTAAPQSDSYVSFGSQQILTFDGAQFGSGVSGTKFADTPVGSWVALCFMRSGNTLYYFVNGVMAHSVSLSAAIGTDITFHFGKLQQTYKQIDELRVLNFANYPESGYTPSSIQFDTNLALVLPTDQTPIADEYWDITVDGSNLLTQYKLDWWDSAHTDTGVFSSYFRNYSVGWNGLSNRSGTWYLGNQSYSTYYQTSNTPPTYPNFYGWDGYLNYALYEGTILLPSNFSQPFFNAAYGYSPVDGLSFQFKWQYETYITGTDFTFTMVGVDGSVGSLSFVLPAVEQNYTATTVNILYSADINGYQVIVYRTETSSPNTSNVGFSIIPTTDSKEFVYLCLEQGSTSTVTAEHVTGIVGIPEDQLNTPTLAVRTDQHITSWSIGGVRPSVPKPGMVWALVENEIISSLQIYDGYGWTEVDGRIWTGERFVPMSSYNIVTLNDLLDIIGANPSLTPLYTQTAFYKWLQEAWQNMIDLLTEIRDALTGGSGTGNNDVPIEDSEDGEGFGDYNGGLFKVIWNLMKGISDVVFGGIAGLVGSASQLDGSLDVLDPNASINIFHTTGELIY